MMRGLFCILVLLGPWADAHEVKPLSEAQMVRPFRPMGGL